MIVFQLLQNGVVVNNATFPDGATIACDGLSASWTAAGDPPVARSFAAPAGMMLMHQTGAGLGWLLSNGVLVSPVQPNPSIPALRAYAFGKAAAMRAALRTYALPGDLRVICDATASTGIDLQGLLTWGTAHGTGTTNWVDDNGGVVTLTGAQCVALAQAVLAYSQSVFATLAQAMNRIANATITTSAQVDALAWPV